METKQIELFDTPVILQADIYIPYGNLKLIIDWCTSNCEKRWGYEVIDEAGFQPGRYSFKFESEKDYVTFIMWKK